MKQAVVRWSRIALLATAVATPMLAEQNPPLPPQAPKGEAHRNILVRTGRDHTGAMDFHMGGDTSSILPPGTWWKDTELAKRIELTPDQTRRIEDLFLQNKIQLIHMHASLEEAEVLLEPLLNANPPDQAKALAQIGKIADTRADLEKANAKMLLSIRGVLNQQQWTKLQQERPSMRQQFMMRFPNGPQGFNFSTPELDRMVERMKSLPMELQPLDSLHGDQ